MKGTNIEAAREQRTIGPLLIIAVIVGLIGLPVAVWLDVRGLSERMLQSQASEISGVIDEVRAFYANDVVKRVLEAEGAVTLTHDYHKMNGAIPIPATFSIELGKRISTRDGSVRYRFVSDLPFRGRETHDLDAFERNALAALRAHPEERIVEVSGSLLDRQVRIAAPVMMGEVCVECHNTHPDSPERDWKVGDVRGIQEISVRQPIGANVFAFKYLLMYFALSAALGFASIVVQRRQSALVRTMNHELAQANEFLGAVSRKMGKYLSPQIYRGIFSGKTDAKVAAERKKLTIFFSDVQDFTAIAERLQPEDLTTLLNEYFTEMSAIALSHGATVDKFIGDAFLVFFGDPETKGVEEDARACLRMAVDMQQRLEQLNHGWRRRGFDQAIRARMGINTGYCHVGNFGSDDRMDYTIIGVEANLAARLQAIAEPGGICLSYETYALVRDMVAARPLPPIAMKGISRKIVPYQVEGMRGEMRSRRPVINEHSTGLDLFVDVEAMDQSSLERAKRRLSEALNALNGRGDPPMASVQSLTARMSASTRQ